MYLLSLRFCINSKISSKGSATLYSVAYPKIYASFFVSRAIKILSAESLKYLSLRECTCWSAALPLNCIYSSNLQPYICQGAGSENHSWLRLRTSHVTESRFQTHWDSFCTSRCQTTPTKTLTSRTPENILYNLQSRWKITQPKRAHRYATYTTLAMVYQSARSNPSRMIYISRRGSCSLSIWL